MIDYIKNIDDLLLLNSDGNEPVKQDEAVRGLLNEIRDIIAPKDEQVGVWETIELNYADRALDAGFFRLALITARQALCVSQLSPEAYEFGLNLAHPRAGQGDGLNKPNSLDELEVRAGELFREQQVEARSLLLDNESAAQDQKAFANTKAALLREAQLAKADKLLKENQRAAQNLLEKNNRDLNIFSADEAARASQEQTLMHLLSASSGAYSSEGFAVKTDLHSPYRLMRAERDQAAHDLKDQQMQIASELEAEQLQAAVALKASDAIDADRLHHVQEQAADNLLERQAIKAIRKKNSTNAIKLESDK